MFEVQGENALSIRTTILPDIKFPVTVILHPLLPNLGARQAFIVTVVPFPNVLRHLDGGIGPELTLIILALLLPGQAILATQVQELQRSLCAVAWRDITTGSPNSVMKVGKGFDIGLRQTYTWASLPGTISRSSPINALPVALTRFSPLRVRSNSVIPVCLPLSDHSVSPWRTMKARGVAMTFKTRTKMYDPSTEARSEIVVVCNEAG